MQLRAFLVCAFSLSAIGCGGDDGGGGLPALFEALNGDYQIREESDCVVAIRGSRFETRMSSGETTCTESYVNGDEGTELAEIETLRISGTLSDTRLTGTLFNEESYPESIFESDCIMRHGVRNEVTASLGKEESLSTEGRFAGLAGTWEGEVTITELDFNVDCDGDETTSNERTNTYDVIANVLGDSIDLNYLEAGQAGEVETFEVLSSTSGDLIVDGEIVRFESE
jgi:hypothetical protein